MLDLNPSQRTILLALTGRISMSVDALAHALYGSSIIHVSDTRAVVHVHLCYVRKALRAHGIAITRISGGYGCKGETQYSLSDRRRALALMQGAGYAQADLSPRSYRRRLRYRTAAPRASFTGRAMVARLRAGGSVYGNA